MDIIIKSSNELNKGEWENYTDSFNEVFKKTVKTEYFTQKYLITADNNSYHAILKDNDQIVGACTIIPFRYNLLESKVKIGLAVDVFIKESYRVDPFILFRMYKKLKQKLIENNICSVIAVPNDIAYPYWKNIVKWKDIGLLSYYALPVKLGNVLNKFRFTFNIISQLGSAVLVFFSNFIISKEKKSLINIDKTKDIVEKQRYYSDHKIVEFKNIFFVYRIVIEDNIKTCYLIDFYNKRLYKKDNKSLRVAVKFILKNESVDLFVFVGKLSFLQMLLIRVPKKLEPKKLYFTIDILDNQVENIEKMLNINNWDFGLFNYDVR